MALAHHPTLNLGHHVAILVGTFGGFPMVKLATVRELKNRTTALIREAEKGKAVVVTRRGKPVATLKSFEPRDLREADKYPTSAFDALKEKILAKHPQLAKESAEQARQEFERISRRIRRSLPFKHWQEMDRWAKGDRYGLGR